MSMKKSTREFDVGYRKPPKATRFKKGVSGNEAGRPRGLQTFGQYLSEALNEKATVTIGNKQMRLTMREIIALRLVLGANQGKIRDQKMVLKLMKKFDPASVQSAIKITVIPDKIAFGHELGESGEEEE